MNRKNIIIIISILAFIVIVGGISYSYFVYNKDIGTVSLSTGEISLNLSDVSSNLNLSGVIPQTDNEGMRSSNYFDFTVNSTVDTEKIYYEVYLLPKTGNTLDTSYLKTYLTDQNDVEIKGVTLYDSLSEGEVEDGKVIYKGLVELNSNYTSKTETKDFRLRLWLDDSYNEQASKTFQFDIYVYAKNVPEDFALQHDALSVIAENVDTETTINFANISSPSNGEGLYILPGTENDTYPIYYYRGEINNNNVIFGGYCWQMVRTTDTGGIKMIYNGVVTGNGETCENTTSASRALTGDSEFNSERDSVSDVGYMSNARYEADIEAPVSGAYFGTSVEYGNYDTNNPGTNVYRLVDDGNGSVGTTKDATHHYTCNETTANGICTQVRYYFYNNYYIILAGGETVEDAVYKMTGNGTNIVKQRNAGYVLNQNDSTIKTVIESWFETNLTNIVDNTKTDYRPYLEDTVYCNDRSFRTTGNNIFEQSGWNPNGGAINKNLYFGSTNRVYNSSWFSETNVPSTACPNETDRFSVSSSVAHLNYPVGLLTADEVVMAGASGNSSTINKEYYLYTDEYYWTMSPRLFHYSYKASEFRVCSGNTNGGLDDDGVYAIYDVRPVISLKFGVEFETGGDGTPTNPYVVKYN